MRWFFRRGQKSDYSESTNSQEPKKSILRSKSQRKKWNNDSHCEHSESESSVADLRSTTPQRPSSSASTWGHANASVTSLQSTDAGNRRNVLFLDEVQRNRKFSGAETSYGVGERTQTPTYNFPSSSYASYPASYQPSPVLPKRDIGEEIELISRSPMPSNTQNSDSRIWVASPVKHSSVHLSLTGRKFRKKHQPVTTDVNGSSNMIEGLVRFPRIIDYAPSPIPRSHSPSNFTATSGRTTPLSDRTRGVSCIEGPMINNAVTRNSSVSPKPIVRRPVYPMVIEPRHQPQDCSFRESSTPTPIPRSICPLSMSSPRLSRESLNVISLDTHSLHDSTETLRPQQDESVGRLNGHYGPSRSIPTPLPKPAYRVIHVSSPTITRATSVVSPSSMGSQIRQRHQDPTTCRPTTPRVIVPRSSSTRVTNRIIYVQNGPNVIRRDPNFMRTSEV
ncbi:hypothetical protein PHET_05648 [Paragonimus heterotremus]|uniref:Uncharacterized protein n=1 Tax=Paragonimus heterotremus TaxID=100268 RepID=A0A8J4WZM1_9TREM|nr:hypothetical protein PHET_05648 [Paragonimus heterotremus]